VIGLLACCIGGMAIGGVGSLAMFWPGHFS